MPVIDLERLRFVTEHYFELQGLRYVPVGILIVAIGALNIGGEAGAFRLVAPVALLVATIVSSGVVGYAYHRRYGFVQGRGDSNPFGWFTVRAGWLTTPAALIVIASSHFPPFASAESSGPPIWTAAFISAAVCLHSGVSHGARRTHYLPIALGFIALVWLDLMGGDRTAQNAYLHFLNGAAIVAAGIGDHLVLRSAFSSQETHSRASAL